MNHTPEHPDSPGTPGATPGTDGPDVARTDTSVSVQRLIHAPAQPIFDILADPAMHQTIDGSGTVKASRQPPNTRLAKGSRFGMRMRLGIPYVISNTVVEFEENRLIAWRHFGRHIWRYQLEPRDDDTLVTETFDWSGALSKAYIERGGWPTRHIPNMRATLERLAGQVEADPQP